MASWDPAQYLKFGDLRLRPALDLLAQIPLEAPARVFDLGCGAGNVTRILAARWPDAAVTGVDSSPAMLAKARQIAPLLSWQEADLETWRPDPPADLLYSNAALQWLGGHERLFPHLLEGLAAGGVLAVQMPDMHDNPFRRLQGEVAADGPWAARLGTVEPARAILTAAQYYDLLRPRVRALDIWTSTYLHVLEGPDPVVEWAKGTSLRPFLDPLDVEERAAFTAEYARRVAPHFPPQADGRTLFPFRRLFIVAVR